MAGGDCLALAAGRWRCQAAPSYDPWAWVVFGREIVGPGPGLSTVSGTGWKPLAVLFTAPLGLFGSAGPSLWLVVVRCAGLVAMLLAFRLSARVGGVAAGALAALALLACSQWLRFLSAGNVEPLVVALLLGAIELHLRGRRGAAFLLGALAGLGRPEVWLLVAGYAGFLWRTERRWGRWPSGSRPWSRCGSCPTGSARVTRCTRCTVHSSAASRLPCSAAATRGSSSWAAPSASPRHRWLGAASALVLGWRTRQSHRGRAGFRGLRLDAADGRPPPRSGSRLSRATSSSPRRCAACSPGSGSSVSRAFRGGGRELAQQLPSPWPS